MNDIQVVEARQEGHDGEVDVADEADQRPDVPRTALLEALLLAHADPVPAERLLETMRCSEEELREAVAQLQATFAAPERGLELVVFNGKYHLRTKPICAIFVRELLAVKPRRLSRAALETLAVIAYQQPIVRSEIEKIRGVEVAPTLKTLLERNLVKIIGYQSTVGQPALYATTEEFLKIFAINALTDLPALRDVRDLAREPGEAEEEGETEVESNEPQNSDEPAGEVAVS